MADTFPDTFDTIDNEKKKADTLGDTRGNVKVKPLVETLPYKLRQAKDGINLDTLGDLRIHLLIDMMA